MMRVTGLLLVCLSLCCVCVWGDPPTNIGPSWYVSSPAPGGSLFVKQPSTPATNANGVQLKDWTWPALPYNPANTQCHQYLDSGTDGCCIGTHTDTDTDEPPQNWLPDPDYGHCGNSGEHNCPGDVDAGCTTAENHNNQGGSCPWSLVAADGVTVFPVCRPANAGTCEPHCWGTLECYDSNDAPHDCPPAIVDNSGRVYVQGSFCFQTGSANNAKWCPGCPVNTHPINPDNLALGCVCNDPLATLEHGICKCTQPGFELIGGLCVCKNPRCGGAPPAFSGDPQIGGFQGQSYQFHGLPDEVFNLISTPTLQVNSHFIYLSSGKCDYNDTTCWTHPGTYIDQLGFSFGTHRIKFVAGTHSVGLHMEIDGERIAYGNYKLYANGTDVHIKYHHHGQVHIKTHEFAFGIENSDMFFNMDASLLDHHLLRIGSPKHTITDTNLCKKEETVDESAFKISQIKRQHNHGAVEAAIEKKYGGIQVPLHGLVGQTWRNVLVCGKHWVGTVTDYVASDLFASDYFFNFYHQE